MTTATMKLTRPAALIEAARSFAEPFTLEDLIVRGWELYPDYFGLAGHDHPNSHKCAAYLWGERGLLTLGHVVPLDDERYVFSDPPRPPKRNKKRKPAAPRQTTPAVVRECLGKAAVMVGPQNVGWREACELWDVMDGPTYAAKSDALHDLLRGVEHPDARLVLNVSQCLVGRFAAHL
jgi:hypothetical protein